MTNFANMGKVELRAACKAAGISYGKLNNDGMRAALELAALGAVAEFEATPAELAQQTVRHQADETPIQGAYKPEYPVADPSTMSYDEVRDSLCPGCGIHLSNGLLTPEDEGANGTKTQHQLGLHHEYMCMGCGHQFGKDIGPYVKPVAKPDAHTGKGTKIEAVREERNGIKRPSIGGKCRAVWDALDAFVAEEKMQPTVAIVRDIAQDEGWNVTNATVEFYQWRKFNGISGRAAK